MNLSQFPKVALLWRGEPHHLEVRTPKNNRLYPLFEAFARLNVSAVPIQYAEEATDEIRGRLLEVDGVLVWVDPISDGRDRSQLDPLLKELSDHGIWVSAHPDIIQKIGTKEVLFRTRHFGWGTDTRLYENGPEFCARFPKSLRRDGRRVLKQRRGNGGIGTWKIEMIDTASSDADLRVRVQEARRGSPVEEVEFSDFMQRCAERFSEWGCLIDQSFQQRTSEGMIRCYLVQDSVVGFSTQMPRSAGDFAMAREKSMYNAAEPHFRLLKIKMESEWVPALQQFFSMERASLPALWDADLFYGPKDARLQDTYVLGEINVSAVSPFPDSAVDRIAEAALPRLLAAKRIRQERTIPLA
jgi:hypothetical protein